MAGTFMVVLGAIGVLVILAVVAAVTNRFVYGPFSTVREVTPQTKRRARMVVATSIALFAVFIIASWSLEPYPKWLLGIVFLVLCALVAGCHSPLNLEDDAAPPAN
jgi:hypothetical protein